MAELRPMIKYISIPISSSVLHNFLIVLILFGCESPRNNQPVVIKHNPDDCVENSWNYGPGFRGVLAITDKHALMNNWVRIEDVAAHDAPEALQNYRNDIQQVATRQVVLCVGVTIFLDEETEIVVSTNPIGDHH